MSQAKALEMNGHRVEDIQLLLSLGGSQRKKGFLEMGCMDFRVLDLSRELGCSF